MRHPVFKEFPGIRSDFSGFVSTINCRMSCRFLQIKLNKYLLTNFGGAASQTSFICSHGWTHTFTQPTNLYFNIYPCIFIFRTVFVHSTYFHICVWETCQIRSLLTWLGPPIGHYFNLCNLQSKSTRKRLYSWNNQNKIVRKQFMKMSSAFYA